MLFGGGDHVDGTVIDARDPKLVQRKTATATRCVDSIAPPVADVTLPSSRVLGAAAGGRWLGGTNRTIDGTVSNLTAAQRNLHDHCRPCHDRLVQVTRGVVVPASCVMLAFTSIPERP
jgi:hypothetical protein